MKKKYNYDIDKIEALENEGLSIRKIARYMKWCENGTQAWIKRNYKRVVKYTKKTDKV